MQKNQRSGSATTRPPSCSEEEGEEEERVSNAQRGRMRLHGVVQSSTGLEVDDDRRKSLGERRAGRAGRWWCALWGRVAQLSSRQCLGARSTARARTAARQRIKLSFFLHIVRETEDLWQVSEAEKYLKEQTDLHEIFLTPRASRRDTRRRWHGILQHAPLHGVSSCCSSEFGCVFPDTIQTPHNFVQWPSCSSHECRC